MPRSSRPSPLRVGIVCDQLEIGGQETGLLELLRRLDRRRFQPHVYALTPGPLLPKIRRLGIPVLLASQRRRVGTTWTRTDARIKEAFRRRLASALRSDRIDVVLVFAWADAMGAAREAGVPAIVERVDGPKLIGWVRDKSSCTRIICQSEAIARLIDVQRQRFRCEHVPIDVVRNGIDLARFDPGRYNRNRCRTALGLRASDFVVGTVARLVPVKNLGHLLDAVRPLLEPRRRGVRMRVIIAGPDGGSGAALRAQARSLGIARHVRFLGPRDDVPQILRALDAFVLPSIQEGVPFSLLEAMAMGLPVVVTQSDSVAETMQDNGYLVGPLDPPRTTLALRELRDRAGLAAAMGRRSRRLAEGHDLDVMVRQYERVLSAASRAVRRHPSFLRRIALMTGHVYGRAARGPGSLHAAFMALRRERVDAYVLETVRGASRRGTTAWPPGRRHAVVAGTGWEARGSVLQWIQPDVIVTNCPQVVQKARARHPGEEIVFMPDPSDTCTRLAQAVRLADRVVLKTPTDLRESQRRWPASTWKMSCWPTWTSDPAGAAIEGLSMPRPVDPASRL